MSINIFAKKKGIIKTVWFTENIPYLDLYWRLQLRAADTLSELFLALFENGSTPNSFLSEWTPFQVFCVQKSKQTDTKIFSF